VIERFPGIVRDQTPKYTKAFRGVDRETYFPLATMHRLHLAVGDLWATGALALLTAALLAVHLARAARARARRALPRGGAQGALQA
jgi:hypothetical protein